MTRAHTIQYTIRRIPPNVDQAIRKQARKTGKSFSQTVVDLVALQAIGTTSPQHEDFDWLFGQCTLDENFDEAVREQSRLYETLWQ